MAAHYHAVLWIDHQEAESFISMPQRGREAHWPCRSSSPPSAPQGGRHRQRTRFRKTRNSSGRVAASIADAGIILVTGPANAKIELVRVH